jgi:hypothetical protein
MSQRSRPSLRRRRSCLLSPHQRVRAAENVLPPLPDRLLRDLPSSLLVFQTMLKSRFEGTTGVAGRSDGRGQLQAHAGVDLIPREIVGLADGLHLGSRILPDRGMLYCYPPERISWRNGVVCGLRLSPCHATRVHTCGEGCDDDISRGSFSQGKYTGGLLVPNGIFSAPPRAGRPVESSLCVSPPCNYSGANSITFEIRVDPGGASREPP